MEYITVARPYAKAIFYLAKNSNSLDDWNSFLDLLSSTFDDVNVANLIKNRTINYNDKASLIIGFFDFTSITDNETKSFFINIINVLAYYNRLLCIKDIYFLYKQYMNIELNRIEALIKVPVNLSSSQKDDILNYLSKRFDKKVSAVFDVDELLLGGFLVKVGDFVLDASIAGNLASLGTKIIL